MKYFPGYSYFCAGCLEEFGCVDLRLHHVKGEAMVVNLRMGIGDKAITSVMMGQLVWSASPVIGWTRSSVNGWLVSQPVASH